MRPRTRRRTRPVLAVGGLVATAVLLACGGTATAATGDLTGGLAGAGLAQSGMAHGGLVSDGMMKPACGQPPGSPAPTGSPSPTGSVSPTGSPSPTSSASPTGSVSPTGSASASPSPSPSGSISPSASPSPSPSDSASPSPSDSASPSPSGSASGSASPTGSGAPGADDGSAAAAYGWGDPQWADEFDGTALGGGWAAYDSPGNGGNGVRSPGQISVANGVMTQTGTADALTAGMVDNGHAAPYGRWEARVATPQTGSGGFAYHPVVALIPGNGAPYHCGATDVDFAEHDIGEPTYIFIHNLPDLQDYTTADVDAAQWHDFAVEIAPDHISWFVDGKVVMTDTDRAAVSGVSYSVNFQLDSNHPGGLNPAQLQVDWTRFYPLPDGAPAPAAPGPQKGSYNGAC